MELREVVSSDKATIVIQINPQVTQNAVIGDGQNHNTTLARFLKAQPKTLGTVQIMIGMVVFLIGIVLTVNNKVTFNLSVFSGITYWGSFIYIIAGSLSVAAQNKLHLCVVKASLGMNVLSFMTAVIAVVLMSIDTGLHAQSNQILTGIYGVLLVLTILQFFISICVSGFACRATCLKDPTVISVAVNQGY